ncbi:MAG: hypothetical protein NVSMB16_11960 [Acidimicrobiales bacterium]
MWSGLVSDAKTPERRAEKMQAAAERTWTVEGGETVPPARWRGDWNEIISR